jgi:hypothetical protein
MVIGHALVTGVESLLVMRLPLLFRRENTSAAQREREEAVEKLVTDGLRTLSDLLKKMADAVEQRRLSRSGYANQERFLERSKSSQRP